MLQFKHVFWVNPRGLSGGLGLFWNDNVNVQVMYSSLNVIQTCVTINERDECFDCSFVYGDPVYHHRRMFWTFLLGIQNDLNRPWCCIGDFNDILRQHEKEGLRRQRRGRMENFCNFVNQGGLMDMDLKGCKFTWVSNPRDGVVTREKLDRVLVNWEWRSVFPHAISEALPIISSDHSPILLRFRPKGRSDRQFKFETYWEEHEGCREVVRVGWNKGAEGDSAWRTMLNRTQTCRRELVGWQGNTFKNAEKEIQICKEKINDLLNRQHRDINWEEVKMIQKRLDDLWKQEEIFWGQRSRVKWLNWGDRNSSFFHASTIQRRERNRIVRIKNSVGDWVEGHEGVMGEIQRYFSEVYRADDYEGDYEMLQVCPKIVSAEMNEKLMAEVGDEEIRGAVFSLGANKAPDPDGFNGVFFQKNWESIREEFCSAVKEFFTQGILPLEVNETLVTLVPKMLLPESINQMRPISCCNFIYKVISKIIVSRLRNFMGQLISLNQSAFVGGRLIQDNLVIAQEVFHALKKRDKCGKGSLAIKLDMNKAYDHLDWRFIQKVLLAYGFSEGWVNMVMKLISTVSYRFKVNGFLSDKIVPGRGLRQGDPISPYIFILAADVLSHMLSRALGERNISGIQLARTTPTLTHLFFADDAVLFARASEEEAFQLIQILNDYSKAFGQRINTLKSGIIFGKFVPLEGRARIKFILGIQEWDNPGKYLGLPADWGRSRSDGLAWIREWIMNKIEGWKENLLNMAGKEVLIKAVLQAIPAFAMSIIRFPQSFCKGICADIARFWWSSGKVRRGMH